jgi:DNA (cytosine-5)-methyltransferase 1
MQRRKNIGGIIMQGGFKQLIESDYICMNGYISDPNWSFLRKSQKDQVDNSLPSVRVADLFSGCGGLSLGVQEACNDEGYRFEAVFAVDIDPICLDVYKANFNPIKALEADIREIVDGEGGADLTWREKSLIGNLPAIDILLAGPPCQGHSDLNNHTRREDERNMLYERVGRFAEITNPTFILIENVPNIIHSHEKVLDNTVRILRECGYQVDTGVVDLSDLGIPQRRKRHILIASEREKVSIKAIIDKYKVPEKLTLRWAIGDLEQANTKNIFNAPTNHNLNNMARINYLFKHDIYDLPNPLRPPCHQNGHSYKSMYGRMKYDEPAQTITSGYGCPGQGRFIHPNQPRTLTPHEAARVQFFPDFFDFTKAKNRSALAFMIGNAVPMKLSYVLCMEFLAQIANG